MPRLGGRIKDAGKQERGSSVALAEMNYVAFSQNAGDDAICTMAFFEVP
jgi:hypothetical protein